MMNDISGAAVGDVLVEVVWRLVPTVLLNVGAFDLLEARSYSSRLSDEKAGRPCCDLFLSLIDVLPVDSALRLASEVMYLSAWA